MIVEVVILLVLLAVWWKVQDNKKNAGCPPGPFRFPFVGNLPQFLMLPPLPAEAMEQLSAKYGDVMTLKLGAFNSVVFSSQKTIMEVFHHETAGVSRAKEMIPMMIDRVMSKNLGLIWSTDETWQTLRRYTMRTLKDFGFGKSTSMDYVMNEEMGKFITHFDKQIDSDPNGIVKIEDTFDLTIINILWRLVTGVNYELGNPKMLRLLKLSNEFFSNANLGVDLVMAFPFLHEYAGRKRQLAIRNTLYDFCRETITEHREAGNYSTDPQCFVDAFLAKIEEANDTEGMYFTDDQLLLVILDLFQAGAETSSKTLGFALLYMILYPEVQRKVQEEVDSVIPEGSITWAHRDKIPYTQATLLEIHRYSSLVPFPVLRKSMEDFYCGGYLIKKNTALLLNTQAVHYDKRLWKDPKSFNPDRFLTSAGTIDHKAADNIMAFGKGKRICLGMNLAEYNLFIYFTELMRRYKFLKVDGQPDPTTIPLLGITYSPQPFDAKVVRRT